MGISWTAEPPKDFWEVPELWSFVNSFVNLGLNVRSLMSEVENVRRFNSYNLSNENITYILLNKCCYEKMRLESFETTNSESMTDLVCS